jgi:uncharacterized protein (DUF2062 family)
VSVIPAEPLIVPTVPRTFWQRRVRDPVVAQLTQGITPHKIALTLAVGSAFALFPILGTSTLLCFLAALTLKLNQPITQLINQALWPVHVPAIFLCVRIGERLFSAQHVRFSIRYMNELLWSDPRLFLHTFGTTAFHAVAGWLLVAPFYVAAVYYIALPVMREVTRIKAQAAVKGTVKSVEHPVP